MTFLADADDALPPAPAVPIRISIVEDDPHTRRLLGDIVTGSPSMRLVSDFSNCADAIAVLPTQRPDVVLMDVNLPEIDGIECVRRLKPLLPKTQYVMLTMYDDPEKIFAALSAGATGYLLKSTSRDELISGILQVHAGGSPMSSAIARKVVRSFAQQPGDSAAPPAQPREPASPDDGFAALSEREQEILGMLAQGFLYKEIADKLALSVFTVKTYTRRIYEKLQVHSRSQATAKYYQRPSP